MENDLSAFTKTINQFDELSSATHIDLFVYFFTIILKQDSVSGLQINSAFSTLRLKPYSNVNQYLNENSNKAKSKNKRKKIKFIKTKFGFHLESRYQKEIESNIVTDEKLIDYSAQTGAMEWKAVDIPYVNSDIIKNADFFAKLYFVLYQLENSIRKFIKGRLNSIYTNRWEVELINKVDLQKAQSIKKEVDLSEMLPKRGDNILCYCMWDDYGKILRAFPSVINNSRDNDELIAHLNTIAKIRNAIAHNAYTIPSDYKAELSIFINKYIKIISKQAGQLAA